MYSPFTLVIRPTSTRREPSSVENPISSVPPVFNRPQEPFYVVNLMLIRIDNSYQDLYKPVTQEEGLYKRAVIDYQTDSIVDTSTSAATAIEGDITDVNEVDVGFQI